MDDNEWGDAERRAQETFDRNRRRIESGETFAAHKPDFDRGNHGKTNSEPSGGVAR
jgi:hypothetical protein